MNDREIKYLLTGDASKLKSELTAVQKQAEDAGKSIDRALTNAFKGAATRMTAEFAKNIETINKGLNNVQKGTQNAFNAQSIAQYAKGQSAVAAQLQRMEQQYVNLDRTASRYRRTLINAGTDASTAGSITTQWLDRQRQALQESGRAASSSIGQQFGGIGRLAPTIAAGIKQVDDNALEAERALNRAAVASNKLFKQIGGAFGKSIRNDITAGSRAVLGFGSSINEAASSLTRLGFGLVAAFAAFAAIPLLKTITLVEQAQLGLESLLSSAEEAGAAIYRIYEFANQTAYPTASLIAYEQKLVSVGLSAEQAFGVISRVSDIGGAFGATGDQLDRFYYVLSQIFGAGRAMGQDFLQIQNSLPGFISAIGQAMGKSAGEVRAAFGDGSVTSQVIADALNILTEEGGKAFQGAARQSSTLSGMMNNLVDNLKRVGMAFFGVRITMDGMQPSVDGLYAKIKRLVGAILEFAENPLAVRAFEVMGDALGNVLAILERFPQVLGIAAGLFVAFATDLITRIPFIGNLIGGISYGTGLLLGVFIAMVTASKELQNALVAMAAQFLNWLSQNQGLFLDLLSNFRQLLATIGAGVAPAMIILTQIFLNFMQVVLNVINFVISLANAIATALGPEMTRAITLTFAFMTVALALAPVINSVIGAIVGLQVAMASLAFRISIVIALIVALIGVMMGLFGQKPEASALGRITDIFDDIDTSSGGAASGIEATGDALADAGKAAAKASKQLAAFDKMNVINSPTGSDDSGAGGPGNISGLTPPAIKTPDLGALRDKFKSLFDDIEGMVPKFSWLDLIVPAAVFGGLYALNKALAGLNWATILKGAAGAMKALPKVILGGIKAIPVLFMGMMKSIGTAFMTLGPLVARAIPGMLKSFALFLPRLLAMIPGWGWAIAAALTAIILVIFNWEAISGWFSGIFENIVIWFEGIGQTIGQIFLDALNGSFGIIPQIFASMVVLVVAVVAIIIETLAQLPVFVWDKIIVPVGTFFADLWWGIQLAFTLAWSLVTQLLGAFAGWVNEKIITPVKNFFVGLWNGIVATATAFWNKLVEIFSPIFRWIKEKVIDPVATGFSNLWNGIVSVASGIFNRIKTALSPIFNWINDNIVRPITSAFEKMSEKIKQVFGTIKGAVENAFNGVVGIIKGVFNGVIDAFNKAIDAINKIKVPDQVPGLGGMSPNFPRIPRLARGGVVDDPTLAIIGEAGKEAVMPLENNTGWIDELAGKLNSQGGNQPTVVNVYLDGNKVGGAVSNSINNRSMVTGVNQIYV